MRNFIIIFCGLFAQTASAGYFISKGGFVTTFIAVGNGKTRLEAIDDAKKAIPKPTSDVRYEDNSSWTSPGIQCVEGGVWTEKNECMGNAVQYSIALRRVEQ